MAEKFQLNCLFFRSTRRMNRVLLRSLWTCQNPFQQSRKSLGNSFNAGIAGYQYASWPPFPGIGARAREASGLARGRLEAVATSVRIEDSASAKDFLNWPMPCPSDCPNSGNRLGPKITNAIPRIRAISGGLQIISW